MKFQLFYDPKEDYGFCSNFFPLEKPIKIDGEEWRDTEQYFQAMKFRGKNVSQRSIEYSNLIKEADSPMKVKMLGSQKKNLRFGKKWVLNKNTDNRLVNDLVDEYKDLIRREDWERVKIQVMIKGLLHKFREPTLLQKLSKLPPDTLLVEHTTRDTVWADGGDGGTEEKGKNYLGKILTVIAYFLRDGSCQNMSDGLKEKVLIKKRLQTVFEYGDECSLLQGKFNLSEKERKDVESLQMSSHKVFVYGKYHDTPREVGFYSDADIRGYGYSGNIIQTQKMNDSLRNILERVNQTTDSDFNAILINRYRDGSDYIGAHSDEDRALGKSGVVSISLGETRTFRLRDKKTKKVVKDVQVKDGDLCWMKGDQFQKKLTHEIPKEKGRGGMRISLTFRKHLY